MASLHIGVAAEEVVGLLEVVVAEAMLISAHLDMMLVHLLFMVEDEAGEVGVAAGKIIFPLLLDHCLLLHLHQLLNHCQ